MSQAKSMKEAKLYIGPQILGDQTQAEYEALTYVEVKDMGTIPEIGSTEEIIKFNPLSGVARKAKGNVDAGDLAIDWARIYDDPGQVAMIAAGRTAFCYAVKIEYNDKPAANYTPTYKYLACQVSEVMDVGGTGADFIKQKTTLGNMQRVIEVLPAVIP